MYCIAIPIKLTEGVEQRICIKFYVKWEHSSVETIWMIQKATPMGNWWWAASSWQCTCSCITSGAEFFGRTSIHPGHWVPLKPRFGTLWLLAFPKLNSPLKGKRFQTVDEIQENTTGQLTRTGRIMWGTKVSTLKGTEVSLSYVQRFLYLVSPSIVVSIFHNTWLDTFWTGLMYIRKTISGAFFFCFSVLPWPWPWTNLRDPYFGT